MKHTSFKNTVIVRSEAAKRSGSGSAALDGVALLAMTISLYCNRDLRKRLASSNREASAALDQALASVMATRAQLDRLVSL